MDTDGNYSSGAFYYGTNSYKEETEFDEFANESFIVKPYDSSEPRYRFCLTWDMNYVSLISPYGNQIAHATCSSNQCLSTVKWEFNEPFTGTLKVTRG